MEVIAEERVSFDSDLPEYRTHGGVNVGPEGRVTSPAIMWVKALDMLMERLRISGLDFSEVKAVSGCAQSHGSVFWRVGAGDMLRQANPDKFLHEELAHAFSVLDSPVWMDSSTSRECRTIEALLGGAEDVVALTGSRIVERFTAPQVAKIAAEKHEAVAHTDRVALVSSFACSLFLGDFAPVDFADAGGTNLFDFRKREWSEECLEASHVYTLYLTPLVRMCVHHHQGSSIACINLVVCVCACESFSLSLTFSSSSSFPLLHYA